MSLPRKGVGFYTWLGFWVCMSMKFTIKLYKGERYYIARVPELGITTQGSTREEARRNLREAIQTHLEAMADYAMEHGKVVIEKGQLVPAQ
jgi:predicted RNase H-like HicB family nuclease